MQQLLLWQFLSHILSDFYLQSDSFCKNKECKAFRSWQLYAHIIIVFAIAWLFSFSLGFWKTALIIAGTHLLFDGLKGLTHNLKWHFKHKALAQFVTRRVQRAFFYDQILHLVVIVAVCYGCGETFYSMPQWLPADSYVAVAIGVLLCLKPANICIKQVFTIFNIQLPKNKEEKSDPTEIPIIANHEDNTGDLPNAGKVIGNAERILTLIFILLGQYAAIGFLMAAKSLLRFAEGDKAKSEYVLVGTLLSFFMAVAIGVIIKIYFHISL